MLLKGYKMRIRIKTIVVFGILGLAGLVFWPDEKYNYAVKKEKKTEDDQKFITKINSEKNPLGVNITRKDRDSTSSSGGKILLLTYCRSGSTFTSEILQQDEDVFFWFEPFRNTLYDEFLEHIPKKGVTNKKEALQFLEDLFNCNLLSSSIPKPFWKDKFQMYSRKGKSFQKCLKKKSLNVTECLLELQKICQNSKFILIKATRIYMETVEPLIERYKDLTVIHLTRDPRGLIFSRLFYKFYVTESTVQKFATNHCKVLFKNIKDSETFIKKYPTRVMQLRYETLACDPLNISRGIYEFCGLTFSSNISDTISSMTMEGQFQKGVMGLKKPNSCEAAYAWKKNITNEVSTKIEKECVPLFEKMHLQNMTYNVRSA